jgi:hypothetical protein
VRDGSLCIYRALPPTDVMASEGMRSEAAELLSFCCWAPEWTREGASLTLPSLQHRQGYSAPPNDTQVEDQNTGTRSLRPDGTGLAAMAGEEASEGGASVVVRARESRVRGEGRQEDDGHAWRGNDLWTRIIRPRRLGYSTFNASFISGAGTIPRMPGGTCGIGSPISATSSRLGAA